MENVFIRKRISELLPLALLLLAFFFSGCAVQSATAPQPTPNEVPAEPTPEPTPTPVPDVIVERRECSPDARELLRFSEEDYRDLPENIERFPELESVRFNGEPADPAYITELRVRCPELTLCYNLTLQDELCHGILKTWI